MTNSLPPHAGYNAGHPWYYLLGGRVPTPKQIRAYVQSRDYQGYLADEIIAASKKCKPQRSESLRAIRSESLRAIRSEVIGQLGRDLSRYRQLAHELRQHRRNSPVDRERHVCLDFHTNLSLKFAHIYNDFAHLFFLDDLPSHQGDLFDF